MVSRSGEIESRLTDEKRSFERLPGRDRSGETNTLILSKILKVWNGKQKKIKTISFYYTNYFCNPVHS